MQLLKKIFDFYINASIHVALAVTALVVVTVEEFNVSIPFTFYMVTFFATVTGYNFVKYAQVAGLHHRSLAQYLKAIQAFSFIAFLLLCVLLFTLKKQTLVAGSCMGLLTILYAMPLLQNKNLRGVPGLKVLIVAIVWAGATVLLPIIEAGYSISFDVWLSCFQRIILTLVLLIPFEIRDVQFDAPSLGTMPQKWGVTTTKKIGCFMLLVLICIELFKNTMTTQHSSVLLMISVLCVVAILYARIHQSRYYAAFLVEGIPIVYGVGMLLIVNFFL